MAALVGLLALAAFVLPGPQRDRVAPRTFAIVVAVSLALGLLVGSLID